jgi:hypothetical integral membrane protein (TIGR02206 family)
MQYFLDTTETIPSGVGFSHFGGMHLGWLVAFLLITAICIVWYRKLSDRGKKNWKITVAVLLVADEIFKDVMLIIGGRFSPGYLPLHLCSINIFLIALHVWRPSKLIGGYLYTAGIPGAIAALLFPTWTSLPLGNFMHLHSFTVHILLALYPITLAAAGELSPQVKKIPQYLLLLAAMAVPIYFINLLLDTNFMFLMSADPGNPLYLFEQIWGNHLYGFPVLITAILIVMYVPLVIFRKIKAKK